MWIGERITENGIGNGISLLIMAGIVSNMFNWGRQAAVGMVAGTVHPIAVIVIVLALLAMIVASHLCGHGRTPHPESSTPSAWWAARCTVASPPTSR